MTEIKLDVWANIVYAVSRLGKECSIADVGSDLGVTYSHVYNLVVDLHKRGLITMERHGRSWFLQLTPKGVKVANAIGDIKLLVGV